MKAVFLDYATMGPGLDLQPLRRFFTSFDLYDDTDDAQIIARIRDAEVVFTNKFHMTPEVLEAAPKLRPFCMLSSVTVHGSSAAELHVTPHRSCA